MLRNIAVGAIVLLAGSAAMVRADAKDDIKAAIQKLSDSPNYSWTTTTETQRGTNTSDGATEKDGYTTFTVGFGDNQTPAVKKGDKAVLKTDDGWQTPAEALAAAGDQPGPGAFMPRQVQAFRTPTVVMADYFDKINDLKQADDAIAGTLSPDTVKPMLARGGRRGGGGGGAGQTPPEVKDPKGSVKFWVKDGVLTKVELTLSGTITFNDQDRDVSRTVTTEFKNVGTTKVDVPDEAKKKLEQPDAAPAAPAAPANPPAQ